MYVSHRELPVSQTLVWSKAKEPESRRRRRTLKRVDRELSKGNFKTALSLVKQFQGKDGGLRGFGAAKLVPRKIKSLDELKLIGIDIPSLQTLIEAILDSINRSIQFALSEKVSLLELESLIHNESYDSPYEDHLMCMQHEAGHFLIGYLLGVLPKRYQVPSMESVQEENFSRGRVEFLGFEFLKEVETATIVEKKIMNGKLHGACKGKIPSKILNSFLCVILGGLVAEHLVFGYSEGLHSDVEKLDRVLKWLGFTEDEAEAQVRWAALNTVLILSRHREARSRLAESMALGRSIGFCIETIENTLSDDLNLDLLVRQC